MILINQVTADSLQQQTLILPDGTSFSLTINFVPMQLGWFITNLSYPANNFILQGVRIVNSPNMLNQFQNQIPFGLACFTNQNREPSQQQDFSSGASQLFILTADEVTQYQELLNA